MKLTANLNLKKPDYIDSVDIQDINDNMDTIDIAIQGKAEVSAIPTKLSDLEADIQIGGGSAITVGTVKPIDGSMWYKVIEDIIDYTLADANWLINTYSVTLANQITTAGSYPVDIQLVDTGPNGCTIKWFYQKPQSGDLINDGSFVAGADGYDTDGVLQFAGSGSSCDFFPTVINGEDEIEVKYTISLSGGVYSIVAVMV